MLFEKKILRSWIRFSCMLVLAVLLMGLHASADDLEPPILLAEDDCWSLQLKGAEVTEWGDFRLNFLVENRMEQYLEIELGSWKLGNCLSPYLEDKQKEALSCGPGLNERSITWRNRDLQISAVNCPDRFRGHFTYENEWTGDEGTADVDVTLENSEAYVIPCDTPVEELQDAGKEPFGSISLGDAVAEVFYIPRTQTHDAGILADIRNDSDKTVNFSWNSAGINDLDVTVSFRTIYGEIIPSGTRFRRIGSFYPPSIIYEAPGSEEEILKTDGILSLSVREEDAEPESEYFSFYPEGEEAWKRYQDQKKDNGITLLDYNGFKVILTEWKTAGPDSRWDGFRFLVENNSEENLIAVLQCTATESGESGAPREATATSGHYASMLLPVNASRKSGDTPDPDAEAEYKLEVQLYEYEAYLNYQRTRRGFSYEKEEDSDKPAVLSKATAWILVSGDGTIRKADASSYVEGYYGEVPEHLYNQHWLDELSLENLDEEEPDGRWISVDDVFELLLPDSLVDYPLKMDDEEISWKFVVQDEQQARVGAAAVVSLSEFAQDFAPDMPELEELLGQAEGQVSLDDIAEQMRQEVSCRKISANGLDALVMASDEDGLGLVIPGEGDNWYYLFFMPLEEEGFEQEIYLMLNSLSPYTGRSAAPCVAQPSSEKPVEAYWSYADGPAEFTEPVELEYDDAGDLIRETILDYQGEPEKTTIYTYYENHSLKSRYLEDEMNFMSSGLLFHYDEEGRVISAEEEGTTIYQTSFETDAQGHVIHETMTDPEGNILVEAGVVCEYDENEHLISRRTVANETEELDKREELYYLETWEYDADGLLISESVTYNMNLENPQYFASMDDSGKFRCYSAKTQYRYDSHGRLTLKTEYWTVINREPTIRWNIRYHYGE